MDFIRMFNLIDTDQSGEITRPELIKFMHENNFTESFVEKWLALFDFNQRGRITMDDFCERLGLVIDEDMHKHLKHHRPSYINIDDLDDFVDVDDKMEQQIIHVSTNKPISTPIKRNSYFQEKYLEEIPEMKEVEKEVITKKTAFPLFGVSPSKTKPEKKDTKNEQISHDVPEVQTSSANFRKASSLPKSMENSNEKSYNLPVEQDNKHRIRSNTVKSSSPNSKTPDKSSKFMDFLNLNKLRPKSNENKHKSATSVSIRKQKNIDDNVSSPTTTNEYRNKDNITKSNEKDREQPNSTNFQNPPNTSKMEFENEDKKTHLLLKGLSQKRTREKGESLANNSDITDHKAENKKKEKNRNIFQKIFQNDKKSNTKKDEKHEKMGKETDKKKNAEHYKNSTSKISSRKYFDDKPDPKEKNTQENRRSLLDNEHGIETEPVFKGGKIESKLHDLLKLDDTRIESYISNEEKLKIKNHQEFEKEMDKLILQRKSTKYFPQKVNNEEFTNNYIRENESKDLVHDPVSKGSERSIKSSPLELNISNHLLKSPADETDLSTSLNSLSHIDKDNKISFNFESIEKNDKDNSSKKNQFTDHNKIDFQHNNSEDVIEEVIVSKVHRPLGSQLPEIVDQDINETSNADKCLPEEIIMKYNENYDPIGNDLNFTFSGEQNLNNQTGKRNQIKKDLQTELLNERENQAKLNKNLRNSLQWNALEKDQENKTNPNESDSLILEKDLNDDENKGLIEDVKTNDLFTSIEKCKSDPLDSKPKNSLTIQMIENELNTNFQDKNSLQVNKNKLSKDSKIIPRDDVHAIKGDDDFADQDQDSLPKSIIENPFNSETETENKIHKTKNKPKDKPDPKSDKSGLDNIECHDETAMKTVNNEKRILQENKDFNRFPKAAGDPNSAETFDKIQIESDSTLTGNKSKIQNYSNETIPSVGQLGNIKSETDPNENEIPEYSKLQKIKPPYRKIKIIHKDFGKNNYPNLVEDIVKIYEETKTADDWNGHERMKVYLDQYYERIWSVIIVNKAYELYVTYENMVIFQYNSLTFILWKTIESP